MVYGKNKAPTHLKACIEGLLEAQGDVLITRLAPEAYEKLGELKERLDYDPLSETALAGTKKEPVGSVAVVNIDNGYGAAYMAAEIVYAIHQKTR